jgi:anti-sigma regulatory factor (Ser/Thr protein kinase)
MTLRLLGIYTFSGRTDEVAEARHLVRRMAARHRGVRPDGRHSVIDDLELLTSEVMANAIVHTRSGKGGQVRLTLLASDQIFRVEVTDQGGTDTKPEVRSNPSYDTEGGRGLVLVEELSKEWGVELEGHGTKTWFEIAL